MSDIQFPNKFPGKCCQCGCRQWTGTAVCVKTSSGYRLFCEQCDPKRFSQVFPQVIQKRLKEAEAARQAAEEKALIEQLRTKLGVDLNNQTQVSYRQEAWCDVSVWTVPFTGDGTDAEFRRVVQTPAQSLYGALRASNGVSLVKVDRSAKTLTLSESVSLCD